MLNIVTENKGIRFLLSCLLFRILRGDFDKDFDESFEKTPLDWELSEDGPEAHYLNDSSTVGSDVIHRRKCMD